MKPIKPKVDFNVSGTIGWKSGTGWTDVTNKNCSDYRVVISEKTGKNSRGSGGYVHHFVGCGAWIQTDPAKPAENSSLKFVDVYVVEGIVPKETKWPDAPIIETPIQGGKIVIKSLNPSSPHCTDGGAFLLEMQMAEDISPGHWGNWKPLKVMWKPLACVTEGSIKDVSAMKPGHYQVRARETNGKYKFTSDWSDWMFFDIPEK